MIKHINKILLILLIPVFMYAEATETKSVKLIKQEPIQAEKIEKTDVSIDKKTEIESQIEQQNKLLEEIIDNINAQKYVLDKNSREQTQKQINLLTNKININKRASNILASKRDELKVIFLKEKIIYDNTLIDIVKAKQEFKDKKYFITLLNKNIEILNATNIEKYSNLYTQESKNNNTISNAFSKNYADAYNQNHTQVFVLEYLKENLAKYRKTNFFIDEFNLQYLVKQIDSIQGVSFVSNLTSYYFKFSIGEIAVVLIIMGFFRLLNVRIISIIANFIARIFVKSSHEDSEAIRQYLRMSIDSPLIYSLYTLAIQISVFILIKDPELIGKIMPWINTVYMALFTWAAYAILNNSINIYAHNLLEKYPNVRREMIVFILRIIKIILILLVILFLFSQLGIDIKAIAASLGVGGIAIALASKDTLANFFGSLNIMTDNSFSQGDWIKTSSVEGTVVDIRMRTTRIRTFDNAMITVPNSDLANTHIMNWSKRKIGRRIKMSVGITYESKMEDIVKLKEDIFNMLDQHQHIASMRNASNAKSKKFEAIKKEDLQGIKRTLLVYIDEFGPSSVDILVYCFSRSPNWEDWLTVKEDVLIQIAQLVEKNNCEFAYPTQTLMLKNDNEIASMSEEK